MTGKELIVAIELGSSKITGIAGRKNGDGNIQIQAFAREDSSSFIRKGVVYNIDKTAECINKVIKRLETTLNEHIDKAYVGIGGQSLRSIKNVISRQFSENVVISQDIIDSINDTNGEAPYQEQKILDVIPQEYLIGTNLETEPVGISSNHIEGRFLNVIARTSNEDNIYASFDQAGIKIAEIFLSPLKTADILLTETEKRSGCALVDFGAETTTVSVYCKNILRHLAVIPLGSNNISKDLCSLSIEENEAEFLKKKYGCAYTEPKEGGEDETTTITLNDGRKIATKVFNEIVEARCEEIIANVWNQIRLSGYQENLLAGITIIGGGAKLKNMELAFKQKTSFDKDIKIGKPFIAIHTGINALQSELLIYNTTIALLNSDNEDCSAGKPIVTDLFGEHANKQMQEKDEEEKVKAAAILEAQKAEALRIRAKKEQEEKEKAKEEERRIKEEERIKKEKEKKAKKLERAEQMKNSKIGKFFNNIKKGFNDLSENITKDE